MATAEESHVPVAPASAAPAPAGMRVLIVGLDRQFHRMARMLFERRGASVHAIADAADVVEQARRHGTDVVILDTSNAMTASARAIATLRMLAAPVGIVLVSDELDGMAQTLPALPKWGPFDDLFERAASAHARTRESIGAARASA